MNSSAKKILKNICGVFLISILSVPLVASDKDSHYVVLGAFAIEKNAMNFTNFVKGHDMKANAALHEQTGWYYVYTMNTDDLQAAITLTKQVQQTKDFWDAWVYTGDLRNLGGDPTGDPIVLNSEVPGDDDSQVPVKKESDGSDVEAKTEQTGNSIDTTEDDAENNQAEESEMSNSTSGGDDSNVNGEEGVVSGSEEKQGAGFIINDEKGERRALKLYVNAYNAGNFKEVKGSIEVIDLERTKRISMENTHESIVVADPSNGSGRFQVFCNIFGFKSMQHDLNFEDLYSGEISDVVQLSGDSLIVDMELFRYDVGETHIMYNVFFYKDAAVIKPESQYELNQLLSMLMENPQLRVQLHGHTNGNSMGKIIFPLEEEGDFFTIGDDNKEGKGSSKKLSHARASSIKSYLISKGVAEERMEIEGWGGKKMLYDKHENRARFNVRVEVEILAN